MPGAILPKPFDGSEHRSFLWKGSDSAALLVHGFPGTPAEMRPLGTVLKNAGWTVHGLMLPGLGADIESLDKRTAMDWSKAVENAMEELKRHHSLNLLVGYSVGGAVALHAAQEQRPSGLVLLAPFWSYGEGWLSRLWPVVKLFFRRVKPLKRADFSTTEVRRGLQRMFKNIDLENPQIQQALRQLTISLRPIEEIRRLGQSAFARASKIDVPTLVIQGSRDKVVPPGRTKHLITTFVNRVEYREVDAGHDLVDLESGAWNQVKEWLLLFAASLRK
ncbi:MAG TPA: alpha/beta fold hydrolase [Candidatus Eisenbacteria bacterium]|jgi:carboxylesterase|nr:alpha/beta fold hydrolase [Candidatus Eisenbacteria bacterium]